MNHLPAIHIEFGDVCYAIVCHDFQLYRELGRQFNNFLSEKKPDIIIELQVVNGLSADEIINVLPNVRLKQEGNHFKSDELALEGDFNISKRYVSIKVERSFFTPKAEFKLINRLFTLAYYTICQWKYGLLPPAMVVHSSAISLCGNGVIFTGPSGSGKTTVARLCNNDRREVINDEMTLVTYPQSIYDAIMVQGIPILGELPQRSNIRAPLRYILSLKQSYQTILRPLSRVEAYLRFIKQIISPAYFGQTDQQALFSRIAEFSDEITRTIPFYELEFTLDKELLWHVLDELEEKLQKEEVKIG